MPAYDAFNYHKRIGELFEHNQNYKDAAFRYERCMKILPDLFEDDEDKKILEEM